MESCDLELEADRYLTVKEVVRLTGVPLSTVRKWCRDARLRRFLDLKQGVNSQLFFSPEAVKTLVQIRVLSAEGLTRKGIEKALSGHTAHTMGTPLSGAMEATSQGVTTSGKCDHYPPSTHDHGMVWPLVEQTMEKRVGPLLGIVEALRKENQGLKARLAMVEAHQVEIDRVVEKTAGTGIVARLRWLFFGK